MLAIELTIDGEWCWGFKAYQLMYGACRVCLFDLGFVQVKITRRKK